MLKAIPALLTPELLCTLASMGHGDRLAIVDRNYPSASSAPRVHHLAGADTASAARAILALFPVDTFDEPAVFRITPTGQPDARFEAHDEFRAEVEAAEGREVEVEPVERLALYELARSAYAIVQTGEPRGYSCFVLVKGVL
ncbi:RbsD/FucU family protein [Propionicimonas sp.]|uniref:RbsD/FucU family protein n=1 Tax=Propionicimonas sp. TaxID=1955623 RepID=UPI0039E6EF86